jgi:chaperonin GroEL
MARPVTNKE